MNIRLIHQVSGRVLWISRNNEIYLARNYQIFQSNDLGKTWQLRWRIPLKGWKNFVPLSRLATRLLRQEIRSFVLLSDGTPIVVSRHGIYRASSEGDMDFVMIPDDGTPLNMCVDRNDRVLFGDYGYSGTKRIYASFDRGRTFDTVYEFPLGSIKHIHGIQEDIYEGGFWVFVGDSNEQSGIAKLSSDLKHLDWVARGSQNVRVVQAIIEPDCLYYGTDSEFIKNHIVRFDKGSGKISPILPVEGSSLFAAKFGEKRVIATCVEPNKEYYHPKAALYYSLGDSKWSKIIEHTKDCWHPSFFQFGTYVLPKCFSNGNFGAFSGQSLKGIDNQTVIFQWPELEESHL